MGDTPGSTPDRILAGRYRLIRRIAEGGMATVWEAEDTVLERRVAIKRLSGALAADPTFVERFQREARAVAGLSHPNVAGVFDYGEDEGGQPFIVMELIDGESLARSISRRGSLHPAEAARIAAAIATALEAAHGAGVVHRDVKPGNVMLTRSGEVKVLDFGIAAAASAVPLTASGTVMGTAAYLSPEVASGHRATAASDVYSLGVVLYEMLTGRPPFPADSPVAAAVAHVRQQPVAVRRLVPDVPTHIAQACERAMSKSPSARPTAAGLAAQLTGSGNQSEQGPSTVAMDAAITEVVPVTGAGATASLAGTQDHTEILPPVPAAGSSAYAGEAERRRPRRPRWARTVAALLIAGAGLAALIWLLAHVGTNPPPNAGPAASPTTPATSAAAPVAVPNVVGQTEDQARATLAGSGLKSGPSKASGGRPGVVTRSDPAAGTKVAPGTVVILCVGRQATPSPTLATPSISIADVSQPEPRSGFTYFGFMVTLSAPSEQQVSVDYATQDGSAGKEDYRQTGKTLIFAPGETTRIINVKVKADVPEGTEENFFINLSNPVNATIADGQAEGTIRQLA